ncbi:non-specific serine/threonine protein kinase [Malassezia vespertilionis]|uniref:Protein kinase domain-containing protein n=1 Tax=Malassezia vespertilionis TaxID=2020962 RepID=A0A2N1JCW5_9BASI|nr:non-specific serine/threonine protein kinase [Malassezia vespertilionis]PKI84386.1 hypothetical protein MVES_001601 [Malassezia vespertilionis]WFD06357.1 non-specific serine/threonine protein kinase [Malassezia vespertilionis]
MAATADGAQVRETQAMHIQTHSTSQRRMLNQYVIEDEIGRGVYGCVRLARDTDTGERVAIKIVPRETRAKLGEQLRGGKTRTDAKVQHEIAILKSCSHPNLVALKEVVDDPRSRKLFLVLEYMDRGEIAWRDALGGPGMTVNKVRRAFRDTVAGLVYLHAQGIVHRDVKPANLLWNSEGITKISDFGVSHRLTGDVDTDQAALFKTAGSPAFFAPELCWSGEVGTAPRITGAIDVWALGVTLYCLLFGHPPFMAETEFGLFDVILKEDYALPGYMGADRVPIGGRGPRWGQGAGQGEDVQGALSDDALLVLDLLDRMLEKDAQRRITLDAVRQHPWVGDGAEERHVDGAAKQSPAATDAAVQPLEMHSAPCLSPRSLVTKHSPRPPLPTPPLASALGSSSTPNSPRRLVSTRIAPPTPTPRTPALQ